MNVTMIRAFINSFELRNDIEPNIWMVVFEHIQKHRKQMIDGPVQRLEIVDSWIRECHLLFFSKYWSQTADLRSKRSANMLRGIRYKLLNRGHHVIQKRLLIE
jgi:hypothetical protein